MDKLGINSKYTQPPSGNIKAFGRNDNSASWNFKLQISNPKLTDYYNGAFQHFLRHLDLGYPSCCSYAEVYRDHLVPSNLSRGNVRLIIPLSITSVDLFPVPPTLTVVTMAGHTAAGGTVVILDIGAGFSRRSTVRRMVTVTPKHLAPADVAGAKRSRNWMLPMFALLPLKIYSRSR